MDLEYKDGITNFTAANAVTGNNDTKNVNIMVLLKYLSSFWRSLELLLINCQINLFWL